MIALGVGGALDSVVDGTTGTFVANAGDRDLVTNFAHALARFDSRQFDPAKVRLHAETFSRGRSAGRWPESSNRLSRLTEMCDHPGSTRSGRA